MVVELNIWISFSYPVLEAILNVTVWKSLTSSIFNLVCWNFEVVLFSVSQFWRLHGSFIYVMIISGQKTPKYAKKSNNIYSWEIKMLWLCFRVFQQPLLRFWYKPFLIAVQVNSLLSLKVKQSK